ncbi:MAG: hypothetical protein J0M15_13990 [Deltaproteobacteria bacterium]|nr:hypothetical protein [Deltaproteobacteria bacterium]
MIKKILFGLGFVLLVFVAIAALKPEDYLIKRDVLINAKPEAVFPFLVSMKNADTWMPWKEQDPQITNSYSGPEEGWNMAHSSITSVLLRAIPDSKWKWIRCHLTANE